jgi:hypothetical protein
VPELEHAATTRSRSYWTRQGDRRSLTRCSALPRAPAQPRPCRLPRFPRCRGQRCPRPQALSPRPRVVRRPVLLCAWPWWWSPGLRLVRCLLDRGLEHDLCRLRGGRRCLGPRPPNLPVAGDLEQRLNWPVGCAPTESQYWPGRSRPRSATAPLGLVDPDPRWHDRHAWYANRLPQCDIGIVDSAHPLQFDLDKPRQCNAQSDK